MVPIWDAFAADWPDAHTFNLLDDSLSTDLVQEGVLAAFQEGNAETHDALIVKAASTLTHVDCIVLGQFSMARAVQAVSGQMDVPAITTPSAAVARLRDQLYG